MNNTIRINTILIFFALSKSVLCPGDERVIYELEHEGYRINVDIEQKLKTSFVVSKKIGDFLQTNQESAVKIIDDFLIYMDDGTIFLSDDIPKLDFFDNLLYLLRCLWGNGYLSYKGEVYQRLSNNKVANSDAELNESVKTSLTNTSEVNKSAMFVETPPLPITVEKPETNDVEILATVEFTDKANQVSEISSMTQDQQTQCDKTQEEMKKLLVQIQEQEIKYNEQTVLLQKYQATFNEQCQKEEVITKKLKDRQEQNQELLAQIEKAAVEKTRSELKLKDAELKEQIAAEKLKEMHNQSNQCLENYEELMRNQFEQERKNYVDILSEIFSEQTQTMFTKSCQALERVVTDKKVLLTKQQDTHCGQQLTFSETTARMFVAIDELTFRLSILAQCKSDVVKIAMTSYDSRLSSVTSLFIQAPEIVELRAQLTAKEAELNRLRANEGMYAEMTDSLQMRIEERNDAQAKVTELEKQIIEMDIKLKENEQSARRLQQCLQETEVVQARIIELRDQNTAFETRIDELIKEINTCKKENSLQNNVHIFSTLIDEEKIARNVLYQQELEEEKLMSKQMYDLFKLIATKLKQELIILHHNYDQYMRDSQLSYETLEKEKVNIARQNAELSNQLEKMQQQIKELEAAKVALQVANDKEKAELLQKLEEVEILKQATQVELKEAEARAQNMLEHERRLQNVVIERENQLLRIEELQQDGAIRIKIQEGEEKQKQLQEILDKLQEEAMQEILKEGEINKVIKDLEAQAKQLQQERDESKQKFEKLQINKKECERMVEDVKKELNLVMIHFKKELQQLTEADRALIQSVMLVAGEVDMSNSVVKAYSGNRNYALFARAYDLLANVIGLEKKRAIDIEFCKEQLEAAIKELTDKGIAALENYKGFSTSLTTSYSDSRRDSVSPLPRSPHSDEPKISTVSSETEVHKGAQCLLTPSVVTQNAVRASIGHPYVYTSEKSSRHHHNLSTRTIK